MNKKRVIITLILCLALLASGCSKKKTEDTPKESPLPKVDFDAAVSVNGTDIFMDEMMFYIYQTEEEGSQSEQMYQNFLGESFWDAVDEEKGMTNRELLKQDTMDSAILYEIFYQKAAESGYELTEEEKEGVKEDAKDTLEALTEKQKKAMLLTEERLTEVMLKISLAYEYYTEFMESLPVDEDKAVSMITPDEYRQYDVEYLHVPTVHFDENYEMTPYTKEEKKEAYKKISGFLKKVKEGTEISDLLEDDDLETEVSQIGFVEGDTVLGKKFEKAALGLENGQVYDGVVEEEDGYYILKMVNNNSTESYENEMEAAIAQAEAEAFEKAYEEMKKDFDIKINEEVWGPVVIGTLTYDENAVSDDDMNFFVEEEEEAGDESEADEAEEDKDGDESDENQ